MRNIMKSTLYTIALCGVALLGSCNDDYDPIGNNKPASKFRVSPLSLAFDGNGGEISVNVNTNVPDVAVGTLPEWVESAAMNEDMTLFTVKAKANTGIPVRTGIINLTTVTGETEASLNLNLVQAGAGANIIYDDFVL